MSRSLAFRPEFRLAHPGDVVTADTPTGNDHEPNPNHWMRNGNSSQDHCGGARVAEIITIACAVGPSSVKETSIRATQPAGVIDLRRASAPPVSVIVGRPPARFTTPISRQKTPARRPVPSALEHASFAAKRLA